MTSVGDIFLGRYELLRELAAPGFVVTFLATDNNLQRKVEVTVLKPQFAAHTAFADRFLAEVKKVMELDHPSITRVYDVGRDEGTGACFIIAEQVEGATLSRYVRDSRPNASRAAAIVRDVAGGLAQAHAARVLHLGLTPQTIVITDSGRTRITGLGLLASAANIAGSADALAASLGTSGYLAPEQILTATGSAASDIYALGLILSETLTGRPTWDGSLRGDSLRQRATTEARLPGTVLPKLDPILEELVASMLALDPTTRPDAQTVAASLAGLMAEAPPAVLPSVAIDELPETELITTVEPAAGSSAPRAPALVADDIDPTLAAVFPANTLSHREFSANEFTAGRTRAAMVSTVVIAVSSIVAFAAIVLVIASTLPSNFLPSTSRIVPNVVGLTYEQAFAAINSAGLTTSRQDQASTTVAADTVISSSPASGAKVEVGSQVSVSVSTGTAKVSVPNVNGMPLAAAREALQKVGLTLGSTTEVPSGLAPKGSVVLSMPSSGTEVAAGTVVNLSLSNGLVRVPSLVGKSITEASAILEAPAIGITPIIKSVTTCPATSPISVNTQSPSPGDVAAGTKVTLTYCSGR